MAQPQKGMSSELASLKKRKGHENESHYARLINGTVNPGTRTRKKDVLDARGDTHSVKSGKKWQIFLYGRERLVNNTVLQGMGDIAPRMIDCIDSLPADRAAREANPDVAKAALQTPMRALAAELQDKRRLQAFWMKAAFEAGEVNFWALLPASIDQTTAPIKDKIFHVFDAKEAVTELCRNMVVGNSKAREGRSNETDDQKVVFRDKGKSLGEIELRTDQHNWGRMKLWLDAKKVVPLLQERIGFSCQPFPQVKAYGKVNKIGK